MTVVPRVGLIVNPIAGMGGPLALHGTDGPAALAAIGAGRGTAGARAARALDTMRGAMPRLDLVVAAGSMGGQLFADQNGSVAPDWSVEILDRPTRWASDVRTTSADTREAAQSMVERGVGLLLFAGGDGTARDILTAVGTSTTILGVPAGVKMHSGVFGVSPSAAGMAATRFLTDPDRVGSIEAEVVDLDDGSHPGVPTPRIFGVARAPRAPSSVQACKSGRGRADDADLAGLGREIAAEMQPGVLYLLGPGITVGHVASALRLDGSVLGVDAVLDGQVIARDAPESTLYDLVTSHHRAALVLGVVGGQGFLLGRGNQQISGRVLTAVGADNVQILAAAGKIAALDPPVLRVDLGEDSDLFTGYRRVRTRPGHSTVLKVVN